MTAGLTLYGRRWVLVYRACKVMRFMHGFMTMGRHALRVSDLGMLCVPAFLCTGRAENGSCVFCFLSPAVKICPGARARARCGGDHGPDGLTALFMCELCRVKYRRKVLYVKAVLYTSDPPHELTKPYGFRKKAMFPPPPQKP